MLYIGLVQVKVDQQQDSSSWLSGGGGHNLYLNSLDIIGILLQNKTFNARSVSLSQAVMRNVGVIFTVMKCVRPDRHYLQIK